MHYLILANFFWGLNMAAGKFLVGNFDPFAQNVIRWPLTALFLFLIYHKSVCSEWKKISRRKQWLLYIGLAATGLAANQVLITIGLQYSTIINATLIVLSSPIIVLLIKALVYKELISLRSLAGLILITGAILYMLLAGNGGKISFNFGDILFLLAALSWAFWSLLLEKKSKLNLKSDSAFVCIASILSSAILIPLSAAYFFITDASITKESFDLANSILAVAYQIIFPGWIAYLFMAKGIDKVGAIKGSLFTNLIPVFAILSGCLFLDEKLYTFHWITMLLLIPGLMLICNTNKR